MGPQVPPPQQVPVQNPQQNRIVNTVNVVPPSTQNKPNTAPLRANPVQTASQDSGVPQQAALLPTSNVKLTNNTNNTSTNVNSQPNTAAAAAASVTSSLPAQQQPPQPSQPHPQHAQQPQSAPANRPPQQQHYNPNINNGGNNRNERDKRPQQSSRGASHNPNSGNRQPSNHYSRRGGNGGGNGRGRGSRSDHYNNNQVLEEFDFESANARFDKEKVLKEVEQQSKETDASSSNSGSSIVGNTTILSNNSSTDKTTPGSPNEADVGQDSSAGANSRMAYDKTKFFDNISCEAKERLISGKPPRTSFAEQRRLDAETFGQLSLHDRHSNSHRYRGGQSSRGSSRGAPRGSNNSGSAPRSSYHNNNTNSNNSINTASNNHHHSTQLKPTQTKVF